MKATELSLELVFDRVLEKVLRISIETVPAERAVLVMDEAGLVVRATANALGEVTLERTPLHAAGSAPVSILEHVLRSGEIVVLGEASHDKRFNTDPYLSTHRVKSVLAVPVSRADRRLGVLYLENSASTDAFPDDRVEKLRLLSSDIAVALENSLLFEESRRAESRLRLLSDASIALAESLDDKVCLEKVGTLIVPALADWWVVDVLDGGKLRPVVFNHADPEKGSLVQAVHEKYPFDLDSAHPQAVALRTGKAVLVSHVTDEFLCTKACNEEYLRLVESLDPGSVIAVPLIDRKTVTGSAIFVRTHPDKPYGALDLELAEELARRIAQTLENARLHQELKEAMRQRIERDRYIKLAFRELPGAVWTTDRNLRFTYATGRAIQEISPRPEVGMSLFDFLGTKDPTNAAIAHHLAALSGERQSFQYKLADRWYAVLLEPLRDEHGRVAGCLGVAFDVTAQRETQERLARSEARLAEAQRVAHVGSFEWDIAHNFVIWSDELHRIYGIEPGQFGGTYEAYLERVDPHDVEATKNVVFDAIRNAKPFEYDHRIIRSDGSVRILHTRGDVITDEHGQAVRLVGSCWDITDLKEAMANLKRARSVLEATIEATADGLLIVDCKGKVTAHNQRFLTLWQILIEIAKQGDDEKLLAFVRDRIDNRDTFML